MADREIAEAVACLRGRILKLVHQIEGGISCSDDLMVEAQNILDMAVQLSQFINVDECIDSCTELRKRC